jgi:hypothetical protein
MKSSKLKALSKSQLTEIRRLHAEIIAAARTSPEKTIARSGYGVEQSMSKRHIRLAIVNEKHVYLFAVPKAIPGGWHLVHNHIQPSTRRIGSRGFRIWLKREKRGLEPCGCGFAPELGTHYRVARAWK